MDKALVFGTKDCRFESCQGHIAFAMLPATSLLDLSLPTELGVKFPVSLSGLALDKCVETIESFSHWRYLGSTGPVA